ncbi:MAG: ECF transporter S component [Oscillospiraceae bacterium]|nr:ECF transporter S component [Oscillospiraceae bacterium]
MTNSNAISTKKLVLTALLAALTVAGSALRITIPVDIAGTTSFHLGNIMCALSGILLGPWYGAAAAAIGSAIYDMMNPLYISEAWITFLTKGCYGLAAGLVISFGKSGWGYAKASIATAAGALTYAALYLGKTYFYSGLLMKGLTPDAALLTVVTKLPATAFNAVVAVIFAPILAIAIRKALARSHMSIN